MRKSDGLTSYFAEYRLLRCGSNWDDLLLTHVRCFRIHFLNSFPSSYSTVHWGGTDNCEASVVVRVELSVPFITNLIARNGLALKGICYALFIGVIYESFIQIFKNWVLWRPLRSDEKLFALRRKIALLNKLFGVDWLFSSVLNLAVLVDLQLCLKLYLWYFLRSFWWKDSFLHRLWPDF